MVKICNKLNHFSSFSTEKAWAIEDFDYEEFDSNDNIDRKYETGEKKAKASKKCREKKKQNKNKSKQIECIDLSSDEEQEPEMEENDDDPDDGDIEFVHAPMLTRSLNINSKL